MKKRNKHYLLVFVSLAILCNGCAITIKPDFVTVTPSSKPAIMRLGEVTETATGTWNIYPGAGFKSELQEALNKPGVANRFANELSNLSMEIHLTSDHADDGPRLSSLGALSIVTLGIIPLNYFSEWNVDCEIKIRRSDDTLVANYHLTEKGSYEIWAFPLTMFSLSGAGMRGDGDARDIKAKVTNNLAAKIVEIIDNNYEELAPLAGKGAMAKPAGTPAPASPQAALIT